MNSLRISGEPDLVRDKEGASRASVSIGTFRRLAEEFDAVYRIGRTRLTDWEKFRQGLEAYRG